MKEKIIARDKTSLLNLYRTFYLIIPLVLLPQLLPSPAYGMESDSSSGDEKGFLRRSKNNLLTISPPRFPLTPNSKVEIEEEKFQVVQSSFAEEKREEFDDSLKRATENNDPETQVQLAEMYAQGKCVEQNLEKALEWYKKAAQNGHGISRIFKIIEEQKNPEEINLRAQQLMVREIGCVMALIDRRPIRTLDLGANTIGDEGAGILSTWLRKNTTLKELDLSSNSIETKGMKRLIEVLRTNTTLQRLNLSWNRLRDEGTKTLIEVLKDNTTLQQLNLSHNRISAQGAKILGEGLNRTLQGLSLNWNVIGDEGAVALSQGLRDNTTIKSLNLHGIEIEEEGKLALEELGKTHPHLLISLQ